MQNDVQPDARKKKKRERFGVSNEIILQAACGVLLCQERRVTSLLTGYLKFPIRQSFVFWRTLCLNAKQFSSRQSPSLHRLSSLRKRIVCNRIIPYILPYIKNATICHCSVKKEKKKKKQRGYSTFYSFDKERHNLSFARFVLFTCLRSSISCASAKLNDVIYYKYNSKTNQYFIFVRFLFQFSHCFSRQQNEASMEEPFYGLPSKKHMKPLLH